MSAAGPVALILAAGKGTRMKSERPKVLFPILGRPAVARVIDAAVEAGCTDVVVVVGHQADAVQAALPGARFAHQERMLGTGDAVRSARAAAAFEGRTVLVLPGDVPLMGADTLRALLAEHAATGVAATVLTMCPQDPTGYGRVVRDEGGVRAIVEHRDATPDQRAITEVNTSIYALDGAFLFGQGGAGAVDRISAANDQGEYYLTDVIGLARTDGLRVGAMVCGDPWQVEGFNDRAQLARLEAEARRRVVDGWLRAGVSMDDPASVRIDDAVRLGTDVTLGARVELRGATVVGSFVTIGPGGVLTDCEVGDGARLGPYVVATRASFGPGAQVLAFTVARGENEKSPERSVDGDRVQVGAGARVGPFAHLRQAAHLGPEAHVGNFVELKKTSLGAGSKANHLAYLGDARIGADVNIGAGVITCNYDGFGKHETRIDDGAFVGTDSHLVAPIRLGRGAYVATGTTVTRDVPADALAIGRARQENKDGYAPRIREQLRRRAERKDGTQPGAAAPGPKEEPGR